MASPGDNRTALSALFKLGQNTVATDELWTDVTFCRSSYLSPNLMLNLCWFRGSGNHLILDGAPLDIASIKSFANGWFNEQSEAAKQKMNDSKLQWLWATSNVTSHQGFSQRCPCCHFGRKVKRVSLVVTTVACWCTHLTKCVWGTRIHQDPPGSGTA